MRCAGQASFSLRTPYLSPSAGATVLCFVTSLDAESDPATPEPDKGLDASNEELQEKLFASDDEATVIYEKDKKSLQRITPCKLVTHVTQGLDQGTRHLAVVSLDLFSDYACAASLTHVPPSATRPSHAVHPDL